LVAVSLIDSAFIQLTETNCDKPQFQRLLLHICSIKREVE
jgi:hypothetical protein